MVMKVGVRYSNPFTFAALRSSLAAVVLLGIVLPTRRTLRPKPFWLTLLYSIFQAGFLGFALWAVHLGGAGKTSVLVYTMPFWLLLTAWPVLGERVRGAQWVAVALALAGLVFLLGPWGLGGVAASVLAVAAGLSWALASLVFKVVLKKHKPDLISFSTWQNIIAAIPLTIVALIVDKTGPTWNGAFIAALLYNVIPGSVVAYLIWLYVLTKLPAGTAGLSALAVPVLGLLAAWLQLGEQPAALEGVGMGLILAALAILTIRGMRENRRVRLKEAPSPVLEPGSD